MRLDVWSDVVCPFCHIGRRRLQLALEGFEHRDEVHVVWHSFQLDRHAPAVAEGEVIDQVAAKYAVSREQMEATHEHMAEEAAAVGLDFQWRRLVGGNSYDAHRLVHFARACGLEDPVTERIMRGWYSEGASIGDRDTLTRLAVEAGLAEQEVRELLDGDDHGIDVRTDEAIAAQLGITAVPTFVFDQKYAVQGAQPVEILRNALQHSWDDRGNRPEPAAAGGCAGGCCGGGGGCGTAGSDTDSEHSSESGQGCSGGGCGGICGEPTGDRDHVGESVVADAEGTRRTAHA